MTRHELAVHFFLQAAVILIICRAVGVAARRFGQPQVVAEMIAGVLLGPSLFGLLAPDAFRWIFPQDSMPVLFVVSQFGLAAYMFVVGLEFRVDIAGKNLRSSVAVSLAGMLAPFALGALLGWMFFVRTDLFPDKTSLFEASIFLGAAMCITAFPMLARIIHFKKLTGTIMGTVALGAGAIDDAAAWCLLALVLASFDGEPARAVSTIAMGVGYVACVLFVVRPLLARFFRADSQTLSDAGFVTCLTFMVLGSWFTDLIGLHAVFGAFVMGIAMPRGMVATNLIARIQPFTLAILLPFFFTYSGLNTRIGLLDTANLWAMAGLVFFAAVLGKGVACAAAARATGIPMRESIGIGTLMNARGLMELIIINIGLQRGIISEALFAILVIMAVATTLMASPLFERLLPGHGTSQPTNR